MINCSSADTIHKYAVSINLKRANVKAMNKSFRNSPFTSTMINTALYYMNINMSVSADTQCNADYNSCRIQSDKFSLK